MGNNVRFHQVCPQRLVLVTGVFHVYFICRKTTFTRVKAIAQNISKQDNLWDICTHSSFYCSRNLFQIFLDWQGRPTRYKLRYYFYHDFTTWLIRFYQRLSVPKDTCKIYSRNYFVLSHCMWKAENSALLLLKYSFKLTSMSRSFF